MHFRRNKEYQRILSSKSLHCLLKLDLNIQKGPYRKIQRNFVFHDKLPPQLRTESRRQYIR